MCVGSPSIKRLAWLLGSFFFCCCKLLNSDARGWLVTSCFTSGQTSGPENSASSSGNWFSSSFFPGSSLTFFIRSKLDASAEIFETRFWLAFPEQEVIRINSFGTKQKVVIVVIVPHTGSSSGTFLISRFGNLKSFQIDYMLLIQERISCWLNTCKKFKLNKSHSSFSG